ncbi:hypothetical protein H7J75_04315 [Mycolicibacterium canariasense]|nr:hypothetical protein [Mycolicibacterium canariasense]
MKYTTTVNISSGNARLIRVPSAPSCTQAKRKAHAAMDPKPRYVNQIASSEISTNTGASAAAAPVQPLTVTGITTTKIAITTQAPERRPVSPSRLSSRCSRVSANGATSRTTAITPSRTAYP